MKNSLFIKKLRDLFGIDIRALAAFRIGLGVLLIWDLLVRCQDLSLFYSDHGVLSRTLLLTQIHQPWMVSIHFMSGAVLIQGLLMGIHLLCAACVLIGYRTRAATIAAWFLLASLQRRNHMVLGGGDDYFRMLFFWAMFVPLGAKWSVDQRLHAEDQDARSIVCSWGTAGLLLQTLIVYWTTVARRAHVATWQNGTAVFDTLSLIPFGRRLGRELLQYPGLLSGLTHGVIVTEILAPILLFFPFRTAQLRLTAALCLMAMHVGFYSCMYLEIFPRVSILALIVFLPALFWDRVERGRFTAQAKDGTAPEKPLFVLSIKWMTRLWEGSAVFFLVCVTLYVLTLFFPSLQPLEQRLAPLTALLHVDQPWAMFGNPAVPSGWLVVQGLTPEGKEVNALHPERVLSWAPPANPLESFANEREREYAMNFILGINTGLWPGYVNNVCRQWNAKQKMPLRAVNVFLMTQKKSAYNGVRTYEKIRLLEGDCAHPYKNVRINYQWRNAFRTPPLTPQALRPPQVAGTFYPAEPGALAAQVDRLLEQAPLPASTAGVVAILVPHAGYGFSGPIAAAAYKALSTRQWDTVILLGPAHRTVLPGAAVWDKGYFQTPLAPIPIDVSLAGKIAGIGDPVQAWSTPHQGEHSLEVQLPFLQRRLKHFSIVPILTNSEDPVFCRHLGESIAHIVRGKRVLLIISSDLSHYPAGDLAAKIDATTLAAIQSMDPVLLHATAQLLLKRREAGLTTPFCGGGALMTGLYAARALGATKATLLKYAYAERAPGAQPARGGVGYASFLFTKGSPDAGAHLSQLSSSGQSILGRAALESIQAAVQGHPFTLSPLQPRGLLNLPLSLFIRVSVNGVGRSFAGSFIANRTLMDQARYWARFALFDKKKNLIVSPKDLHRLSLRIFIISPRTPITYDSVPVTGGILLANGGRQAFACSEDRGRFLTKDAFLAHVCALARLSPTCANDPQTRLWSFADQWFDYE